MADGVRATNAAVGGYDPHSKVFVTPAVFTALRRLDRFLLIGATLVFWEASVRLGWLDPQTLPAPSAVVRSLLAMAAQGTLWTDLGASLLRVSVGFLFALAIGLASGLLCARWALAGRLVIPIIELLRPISVIAWIPLAILWFGLGDRPAWFLICLGCFFPIFTNTYLGARSVDPVLVNVSRCVGASRTLFLRRVLLPSVVPYVIAGMRVGLGVGWMCVIAAELMAAQSGLGYMIQISRTMMDTDRVIAGMVLIGLAGFSMNWAMMLLEQYFMRWKSS
jgi:ABC-type nitrate/sulfonate/bicarbonate transport system permease component